MVKNQISELQFLELLAKTYPNIQSAATEIINLQAILNLPKGTEHFISDLHGENEAFLHILKNASGVIREKIDGRFGDTLSETERRNLANLIYYPEEQLDYLSKNNALSEQWYEKTLYQLIELSRIVASKYTRSKVRKALPYDFRYIIDELIHIEDNENKHEYYLQIIRTIISTERSEAFIIATSKLIQRLCIDHLHIVGDIFDRGPRPDLIIDELIKYHSLDIQWGNHDIVWIGAACGNLACIANVVRNSLRYNNFAVLEEGYGISLRPLTNFAIENYYNDPCEYFKVKNADLNDDNLNMKIASKMHKAITVIQLKLEAQTILRHPEYQMNDRLVLDKIKNGKITLYGIEYTLRDNRFRTVNPENPFELTAEEKEVINLLQASFLQSKKLQKNIKFLLSKGSMYTIFNDNLLFHGCVPCENNGEFCSVSVNGSLVCGVELFNAFDKAVRECYYSKNTAENLNDIIWYLWCGSKSPLYGRDKMATFEGYFIEDKTAAHETKNSYYKFIDSKEFAVKLLNEFGIFKDDAHIVNGHIPVKAEKGESPIKAEGKLFIIDGGLSKAYHSITGIAGYTLVYNSYGYKLIKHTPFTSVEDVIESGFELHSTYTTVEHNERRKLVKNTDAGNQMQKQIDMLTKLLNAFKIGQIKEK